MKWSEGFGCWPARRSVLPDMQNASRREERKVCGDVHRWVVWPKALIGWWVANDEWLLPQQRLAERLLPPVFHLCGEVVRVSSKQLVPEPLQEDAVLRHHAQNQVTAGALTCETENVILLIVLFICLFIYFTFGLLQLDTIWRIRLFRSSMLGMLSLLEESKLLLQIV